MASYPLSRTHIHKMTTQTTTTRKSNEDPKRRYRNKNTTVTNDQHIINIIVWFNSWPGDESFACPAEIFGLHSSLLYCYHLYSAMRSTYAPISNCSVGGLDFRDSLETSQKNKSLHHNCWAAEEITQRYLVCGDVSEAVVSYLQFQLTWS